MKHVSGIGRRLLPLAFVVSAASAAPAQAAWSANQVYEIDFMNSMIDHHAMAVQMASLCQQRATHSELLSMCQDIKATQTAEIQRMQGWMRQWYGMGSTPHMVEQDKTMLRSLANLSGAAFEQQFMETMAGHHMVAIEQSAPCLVRASHGELVSECEDIAASQAGEIKTLRSWLCSWNGVCSLHFGRSARVGKSEEVPVP